ncbi:Ubiquitin carboxyl-terminal hydrolase 14 [Hordeum vulgare]|nr:Ubiquitin carboxyl-terminal hydrolase 14 [Hordeum vulgare]
MNSFLGFGREHVAWNFEKSENPVNLHIVQRRKPEPDETGRPLKKPTLLAIECAMEWALPEVSSYAV